MVSAAPPIRLWFDLRSSDGLTQPVLALPRLGSTMPRFVAAPFGPAVLRHCLTLPPACKTAPRVTSDRLLPRTPDQSPDRKRPANGNAPAQHRTDADLPSKTQYAPKIQAKIQAKFYAGRCPLVPLASLPPTGLCDCCVPTDSDGAPPTVLAATLARWYGQNGTVPC